MFPSLGKPTRSPCHTCARPLMGTSDTCIPVGQVPAPVQTGDAPQEGHSQPLPALIPVFSESSSRLQGGLRGLSSLSRPPFFPRVPPTAHSHCSPHKSSALLHQSLKGVSAPTAWNVHPGQHKTHFLPWKGSVVDLRNEGKCGGP